MPKYVEIKDKEGQPAGFVMDFENGYKEVHDKNGQPSAYIYDQEKMNAAILESVEEQNNNHSGNGWPSIKEDGLFYCIMFHIAVWAPRVYPLVYLFVNWPSAIYSFISLFIGKYVTLWVINSFRKGYTATATIRDWYYLISIIVGYLFIFFSTPFVTF